MRCTMKVVVGSTRSNQLLAFYYTYYAEYVYVCVYEKNKNRKKRRTRYTTR